MSTTTPDEQYTWSPPQFTVSRPPHLQETILPPSPLSNFVRIAKWCPDGSLLLTQCEDRSYRMMRLCVLCSNSGSTSTILTLPQPSPIVDFLWYPTASPNDPASFCFVSSVRDCPVKLLDASNGRLRASYPIIDHIERFVAPHSMAFNPYGTRLYCGFENAIEVFDVGHPGEGIRLSTTPTKKSKDGLKGIISALSFCPSYETDYFAAGSLTPTSSNIAIFSETRGEAPVMFLGQGQDSGFRASVTQLMFNPIRPHLLYASFRRRTEILCWDLRTRVDLPWKIYSPASPEAAEARGDGMRGEKPELTNQKRRFDVDINGRWLSVPGQDGTISIFDLNENENEHGNSAILSDQHQQQQDEEPIAMVPSLCFQAHEDSITTSTFRPGSSHLLSVSGSRSFPFEGDEDVEDGVDGEICISRSKREPVVRDASIKLWKF
ncbi:WD40 repeat-like protein [Marasmius fiardii PR-910]|nr:WD40 repeat-like protein [Marasmius fiardii PR-910]